MITNESAVKKQRNTTIDMLKGIAIVAVFLYHVGLLKSGYLGVDCFFVISGFLTMPRLIESLEKSDFNFFKYIRKKVVRLLPTILIISAFSLAIGFVLWLPNDYENLSESVIASVFFSNNILSGITTKNYWDAINEYKPLMHMWYIGILAEYYILLPMFAIILSGFARKFRKSIKKSIAAGVGLVTFLSLVLFLMPSFSAGDKFYFIPFRFWELGLGGLLGTYYKQLQSICEKGLKTISIASSTLIILIMSIGLIGFDINKIGVSTTIIGADTVASSDLILPNSVMLIATVLVTSCFLVSNEVFPSCLNSKCLSSIGQRSYSIFAWHQVILALIRYSITSCLTIVSITLIVILLVLSSELNYQIIEKRVKNSKSSVIVLIASAILICGYSGFVYLRAGVIRDVPELNISTKHIQRNMHTNYCDRIYSYKDEFEENGKSNILIVGNSFARDWGNILLESEYGDKINLYFSSHFDESLISKIKEADRIFVFENYEDKVPEYVWQNADRNIVYCIGTKNFGVSNGTIYSHRFDDDYFSQTVKLDPGYEELNREKRERWGDHYIDLIEPVLIDGQVLVFTDTNMFISQDCRHLTEAGAKFYAKILDLSQYMP